MSAYLFIHLCMFDGLAAVIAKKGAAFPAVTQLLICNKAISVSGGCQINPSC